MVIAPVIAPATDGVNVMPILQLAPAPRLVPQVLVDTAKSPLDTMLRFIVVLAWLVSVTDFAALVEPTG